MKWYLYSHFVNGRIAINAVPNKCTALSWTCSYDLVQMEMRITGQVFLFDQDK